MIMAAGRMEESDERVVGLQRFVPYDVVSDMEEPVREIRDFSKLMLMTMQVDDEETSALHVAARRINELLEKVEADRGLLFDGVARRGGGAKMPALR
jgi:hypothetical protein